MFTLLASTCAAISQLLEMTGKQFVMEFKILALRSGWSSLMSFQRDGIAGIVQAQDVANGMTHQ